MAPQAKIFSTQRSKTVGKIVEILAKKRPLWNIPPCFAPFGNKGEFSIQFPLMGLSLSPKAFPTPSECYPGVSTSLRAISESNLLELEIYLLHHCPSVL